MDKLKRWVTNPGKYIPVARKLALEKLCPLLQEASFFLQGQMDIHPRSRWHNKALCTQTGGFYPDAKPRRICNLDPHDNTRRDMLILLLRTVLYQGISGSFAELGVYQGLTARLIHNYAPERSLHLFDTFEGFGERSVEAEAKATQFKVSSSLFADTSLETVRAAIGSTNDNVFFHVGFFPDSIPFELNAEQFAFVHLDADLYDPVFEGLKFFYPRIPTRGMIVVHDYNAWPGSRKAVDDFFADKPELPIPMPDKSGSALIVKF